MWRIGDVPEDDVPNCSEIFSNWYGRLKAPMLGPAKVATDLMRRFYMRSFDLMGTRN